MTTMTTYEGKTYDTIEHPDMTTFILDEPLTDRHPELIAADIAAIIASVCLDAGITTASDPCVKVCGSSGWQIATLRRTIKVPYTVCEAVKEAPAPDSVYSRCYRILHDIVGSHSRRTECGLRGDEIARIRFREGRRQIEVTVRGAIEVDSCIFSPNQHQYICSPKFVDIAIEEA